MSNGDATTEQPADGSIGLMRRILATPEGKVFIVGLVFTLLSAATILLAGLSSRRLMNDLLAMTGAHIAGGRAAGMLWGYNRDLSHVLVIATNMAIETALVLLFYPLFVLSYRKLIVIKPLEQTMARTQRTASALQARIMKFGIPGLLLFVWFPFWMTGPLVGCIIGFLIGLRPWVNLGVVLSGTYMAIVCWGILLRPLHAVLARAGHYLPFALVMLIFLIAIAIRIRYAFAGHSAKGEDDDREEPKGV